MNPLDSTAWQLEQPLVLWALLLVPLLWALRERSPAGHPPWRSFGAMVLRALALVALVVALSQPFVETPTPDRSIVVVLDASGSLDPARRAAAEDWLEAAWEAKGEAPGRIVVGTHPPRLAESIDEALRLLDETGRAAAGTDLRTPVELAVAHLPEARHQELVVVSDGAATRGSLDRALRVAAARDLPVHAVPLGPSALRATLEAVDPDQDGLVGEPSAVRIRARANAPVSGRIELRLDGGQSPVASAEFAFGPGPAVHELEFTPESAGLHQLVATLTVEGDPEPEDDVARARVRVQPSPSALVVGRAAEAKALRRALADYGPGLRVDARATLPAPPYDDYTLVALLDPDLPRLGAPQIRGLIDRVEDGGRLLITGGQNGLVVDEPVVEPLAEVLPVKFPKTKKKQRAPLSVVYCLDSSDSMAGSGKFELAAAALAQSLHLLPEESRVGIVGFSDFPSWVVPLGPFLGTDSAVRAMESVRVRGGTSIYHSLQAAYEALKTDDALVKHVVLLSDGQSTTTFARHGDVVTAMLRRRITVSTIAVSADSDRPEMERIAEAGGGRAYYAARFNELPQLFLDEMMQVTRTNKVEETFPVQPVVGSRFLSRVPEGASWPDLAGYVRGDQRPGSELALATADGHPVLVAGRLGRGTIAMFTSDVGGPWSESWAAWGDHTALWAGTIEALVQPEPPEQLRLEASVEARSATLVFDATDPLRNPRGDLVVEAIVEPPSGERFAMDLPPVGPGRYGTTFELEPDGATLVRVAATGTTLGRQGPPAPGGELLATLEPTPPEEVRAATFNPRALRLAAERTGGLWDPSPADIFDRAVPERLVRHDLWPWPLKLALVLLILDLAWRRLRLRAA